MAVHIHGNTGTNTAKYVIQEVDSTYTVPTTTTAVSDIDSGFSINTYEVDYDEQSYEPIPLLKLPIEPESSYWTPQIPTGLTATTYNDTQINLVWTNVDTKGDGVRIERSIDGVNFSMINTVGIGIISYQDTGLTPYNRYYYRVCAYKGANLSEYTTIVNGVTEIYTNSIDLMSAAQKTAVENFLIGLSDNSIISKIKAAYLPVFGRISDNNINIVNIIDTDGAFRLKEVATITHDNNGVQGDGDSGLLDTSIIPATHLVSDNIHYCFSSKTNSTAAIADMGTSYGAGILDVYAKYSNGNTICRAGSTLSFAQTSSIGRFIFNYGALQNAFRDGLKIGEQALTQGTLPTDVPIALMATGNGGGVYFRWSNRLYDYFSIGEALSDDESLIYDILIEDLLAVFTAIPFVPKVDETVTIQSVQGVTLKQITINYILRTGSVVNFNWGYGADILLTGTGTQQTLVSVFPTNNTTYNITFIGETWKVSRLYITDDYTISGDTEEFDKFNNLVDLQIYNTNLIGISDGWSKKLSTLKIYNSVGILVNFDNLSRAITSLDIDHADPNSSGSIKNLPPSLHDIRILDNDLFGGDLTTFPSTLHVIDFATMGPNFTGDFEHLPAALESATFNAISRPDFSTDITGNLNSLPVGLTHCNFTSVGLTIACNVNLLPAGITYLLLEHFGTNMISGDGSDLNANMTGFGINYCTTNLFTLAVSDIPTAALNWVQLWTAGLITGDIEDISTHLDDALNGGIDPNITDNCPLMFYNVGSGLVYGGGNLPIWKDVTMSLDLDWNATMVDAFLINFASRTEASAKQRDIRIFGTRSAASDAAVATLAGLNKIVTMA